MAILKLVSQKKITSIVEEVLRQVSKPKDGIDGKAGRNGRDGFNGINGKNGRDGLDGKDGIKGKNGFDGLDGVNGINGISGKDGSIIEVQEVIAKLNTLEEVIEPSVIKGLLKHLRGLERLIQDVRQGSKGAKVGGGGGSVPFISISTNTIIKPNVGVVLVDASSGMVTITLPPASQGARREYHIKKTDSSVNTVRIEGNGSETIDGEACQDLGKQYTSRRIYSDGNNWHIV